MKQKMTNQNIRYVDPRIFNFLENNIFMYVIIIFDEKIQSIFKFMRSISLTLENKSSIQRIQFLTIKCVFCIFEE
jgi:hypothetical protein